MKNRGQLALGAAAALGMALLFSVGCLPADASGYLGPGGAAGIAGAGGQAGTSAAAGGSGAAGATGLQTGRGGAGPPTGGAGGGAGTGTSPGGSHGGAGDGAGGGRGAAGGMGGSGAAGGAAGRAGMAGGGGRAGTGGSAGTSVAPTFTQIYKSILTVYCAGSECHNPGAQRNVSFATQARAYTSARALITAGNAMRSTFYSEVYTGAMPPIGDALSESNIQMIADWIDAGALNN